MIVNHSTELVFDKKKDVLCVPRRSSVAIMNDLKDAILSKECLKVCYWGGTQPGSIREITPIKFAYDDECIFAFCDETKKCKAFKISKLDILSIDDEKTYETKPTTESFEQALPRYIHLITQFTDIFVTPEDGDLRIHEPYKRNKKRFKTYPFMIIDYVEMQKKKYRVSLADWHRSFANIEEAFSFAVYILHTSYQTEVEEEAA